MGGIGRDGRSRAAGGGAAATRSSAGRARPHAASPSGPDAAAPAWLHASWAAGAGGRPARGARALECEARGLTAGCRQASA